MGIGPLGLASRAASSLTSAASGAVAGVTDYASRVAALLATAEELAVRAPALLDRVDALLDRTDGLLDEVQPVTQVVAAPAREALESLSEEDVETTVRVLTQLPHALERMERTVVPTIARLEQVGPNVQSLRDSVEELCTLVKSLPGMGRVRRQAERRLAPTPLPAAEPDPPGH